VLQAYGLPGLERLAREQRWRAFAATINQINKYFQASRRELLWQHGLRPLIPAQVFHGQKASRDVVHSIVNPDFARRIGLQERMRVLKGERSNPPRTAREDHWRALTSGLFTLVLELSDRCAAAFSIEIRHPFMDKRLIEFCLALPPEQKLYQGWSRVVMRRAMSGVLPEEIQWRGGKTDMTPNFLRGLLTTDRRALDEVILNECESIEKYIDIQTLSQVYQRLISQDKVKIDDAMTIWRVATLAYWLRCSGLGL
jgi:asparagine synthase (glutamine-hydrolysing)